MIAINARTKGVGVALNAKNRANGLLNRRRIDMMLSDEQIADIEKRLYRMPSFQYNSDVAALIADREELLAEIERLDAENHNLKYDNEKVAELQAAIERLKAELELYKGKAVKARDADLREQGYCIVDTSAFEKAMLKFSEYEEMQAERDRLLAENEALKRALHHVSPNCMTCKHYRPANTEECQKCVTSSDKRMIKNSRYEFDFDRFKEGCSHGE